MQVDVGGRMSSSSSDPLSSSNDNNSRKRGVKRQADESSLSDDQRFAKRFNRLNIGGTNACLPSQPSQYDEPEHAGTAQQQHHPSPSGGDGMQVDDTHDRVYIGDIDAELADIEASEPRERLIFLPDIERHFSRIPAHVLVAENKSFEDAPENQQLVLYDIPKSLTADASNAVTRKAILEARRRAQDKAVDEARKSSTGIPITEDLGHGAGNVDSIEPDAMDIE